MGSDFVRACWLNLALTVAIAYVAAPVPKTRTTVEEMTGRWVWKSPSGGTWYVWLDRDGSYRAATCDTAERFHWVGRWHVNEAGTRVVIIEWVAGTESGRDRHVRYEVCREALTGKVPTEGAGD